MKLKILCVKWSQKIFSRSGFILILTEFSGFQPQLEGFFACLDIWTVFLDYLIGKVANARSDKLAEAEATVSRFVNYTKNLQDPLALY